MRFVLAQKAEHDQENEMFDEVVDDKALKQGALKQASAISTTGASADDWDDKDGYYKAKIGEVMGGRYLVTEDKCGQGVFSNVVKATDQQDNLQVAIKIMRCNDMMRKAAEKEVDILERLMKADRSRKSNVIRLLRTFNYRNHLCLVFECMWDNLRVALKKYTKDKGMSLQAVKAYTKQLLVALRHIHRCEIIHADIKPDNILISAGHNVVKICDLGSAMDLTEVEPTPYLVSRFYRAPELCLCKEYGPPIDVWAMGCALLELFTGKILFQGKSNNDMMRLYMEVKGKLPHKMIKSGSLWKQHFDENLDFRYQDTDKVTRKKRVRTITDWTKPRKIEDMVMNRLGPEKARSTDPEDVLYIKKAKQFADLMDKMTTCDPEKRITAEDALHHPFVVEPGPGAPAKGGGQGEKGSKSKEGQPVPPRRDAKASAKI
jgi:serine/threonine-protein kinase PRP4